MEIKGYLSDNSQMKPQMGIIVYAGQEGVFATAHKILHPPKSSPILGEGKPITHENLTDLTLRLSLQPRKRALLPEPVLLADSDMLIWWRPAQRRQVFFSTKNKALNSITGEIALHPPLLFIAKPRGLSIFALPSNERPTTDTILYRAPYYNVYALGAMCTGNAKLPDFPLPTDEGIEGYETAFFETFFTHTNNTSSELIKFVGGLEAFWKMMVASDHKFFPFWALRQTQLEGEIMTLGKVIRRVQTK